MVRKVKKRGYLNLDTTGDKIFNVINIFILCVFTLIMFYPLYWTVIASFSDISEVGLGNVVLWPQGFSTEAYRQVFNHDAIWIGYRNSILYTTLSVIYSMVIMLPIAYTLSKRNLPGRVGVTFYFIFTMYFSGGMIPSFILIANTLGWMDTIWPMVIGGLAVFQMVVTRTFFMSAIPEELYESAEMDGASHLKCFFRIALPLAKPVIAVMALQFAVGSWNSFFGALMFLNRADLQPLQLVIRRIVILNAQIGIGVDVSTLTDEQINDMAVRQRLAESMRYSTIFIASAPMLIIYPFIQKYFAKGMLIGSLKG